MQKFKTLFRKPEFQVFLACLVLLVFSWPLLTIFEPMRNGFIFFYFFVAWSLAILFLLLIALSHRKKRQGFDEFESEG